MYIDDCNVCAQIFLPVESVYDFILCMNRHALGLANTPLMERDVQSLVPVLRTARSTWAASAILIRDARKCNSEKLSSAGMSC